VALLIVGLIMPAGTLLVAATDWPIALRVWVNLGLDAITLASLFVLGGDFWDKVRALFLHDARAVFSS
jgi:hypothetical protein